MPLADPAELPAVVGACRAVLDSSSPSRSTANTASLPLCVIDSVFSIGVRYEGVRAKLRVLVKRILRKYGYPPDKQEQATATVLEQAELLCDGWA